MTCSQAASQPVTVKLEAAGQAQNGHPHRLQYMEEGMGPNMLDWGMTLIRQRERDPHTDTDTQMNLLSITVIHFH